ncbi:integrase core domain-containing protein [Rhodococcus sp. NPDC019647]
MDNGANLFRLCCSSSAGSDRNFVHSAREPWNTGHIESFNDRLQKECLNRNHWTSLLEARVVINDLKDDHTTGTGLPDAGLEVAPAGGEGRTLPTAPTLTNRWTAARSTETRVTVTPERRDPTIGDLPESSLKPVFATMRSCRWRRSRSWRSLPLRLRAEQRRQSLLLLLFRRRSPEATSPSRRMHRPAHGRDRRSNRDLRGS